jgi:hypothetical protein
MTQTEALKLALEALEISDICADDCKCTRKRAINGIKAALEAKDEPVAWWIPKAEQFCLQAPSGERPFAKAWEPLYAASPKQEAKDDSVARYCCHSCFKASGGVMLDRLILCSECGNKRCPKATDHNFSCTGSNEPNQWGSIYTTPPQRKPLTDEEINALDYSGTRIEFVRAIEAKLKEKNK